MCIFPEPLYNVSIHNTHDILNIIYKRSCCTAQPWCRSLFCQVCSSPIHISFFCFKEGGTCKKSRRKDNEIFRFICGTQDIHKQLEAKIARSQIKSLAIIINRMICLTIDMFVRLSYKILNEVLWTTDLHLNHILTLYTEL